MRINLISGFLGSGKTTAIRKACTILVNDRRRVGVITNDQGDSLVDTVYLKNSGIPAREVTAGCFCCNYTQLTDEIAALQSSEHPEVIFAEPVGSCTDLIATVAKPLQKFGHATVVISVFADVSFLINLISGNASFLNDEVRYIYKNQLAEADILILNKIDLIDGDQVRRVQDLIMKEYPGKIVLSQNSLDDDSIRKYLATIFDFHPTKKRSSLSIDYELYARGEAMMGWVDQTLTVEHPDGKAYDIALELTELIAFDIRKQGLMIGHLKFLLDDGETREKISHTAFDVKATIPRRDKRVTNRVSLLVNARVQALPARISDIIVSAEDRIAKSTGARMQVIRHAAFQPGYPRPTHRIVE